MNFPAPYNPRNGEEIMEAKTFRYSTTGTWFKGNTHIHSTRSDGGMTHAELAIKYAAAGYNFLYRTDHWYASDAKKETGPSPVLWLDGIELDGCDDCGSYYHVVCLGKVEGLNRESGLQVALEQARSQGAFLILAHPHWTGNSLEEAHRHGFNGVEVYNHVCHWLNGKSYGGIHWDSCLEQSAETLGFSADDAHLHARNPCWNGGWIMVNAETCDRDSIQSAIRRGNFYSSCGPEFHGMDWDGNTVRIRTSPIRFARLVGPRSKGDRQGAFEGPLISKAHLTIPPDWAYAKIEIEDAEGRRAWTNPLFTKLIQSQG
ncbi:MAG: hypothetical protein HQL31_02615 [Planctomycetes bacterium]|nr:hypothetical protein [Planctomycetota bacterium]